MLAASIFSLIIPGFDYGRDLYKYRSYAVLIVLLGAWFGGFLVVYLSAFLSRNNFILDKFFSDLEDPNMVRRIFLIVVIITIHNFPEGLATGVSFGSGDFDRSIALTLGIALQNIPEGAVVALPLIMVGYKKSTACFIALLSGLVEPVAAFIGAYLIFLSKMFLPIALGFSAGSMLGVVFYEMVPENCKYADKKTSILSFFIGFSVMCFLDVVLS